MKMEIELTNEDIKEVLAEVFKMFSTKVNLPINDAPGQVLCVSYPINISANFKGSVIMGEDKIKQYIRHNLVPSTAYLTLKELWPGSFFILLCDTWS